VNIDDYLTLQTNFGASGLAGGGAVASASVGEFAAVPEPGTLGVLGLAAAGLLRRRRR